MCYVSIARGELGTKSLDHIRLDALLRVRKLVFLFLIYAKQSVYHAVGMETVMNLPGCRGY